MMAVDYKASGVDIELGDDASKILYEAAKATFDNRKGNIGEVVVPFDDFSGVRAIDVGALPKGSMMCMGFDGIGTKVEIAQRVGRHDTIAFDLFAMVCDDAIVRGAEPVLIGSVLDVASLSGNIDAVRQLAKGYVAAARDANVAVINGELAELGDAVGGYGQFKYNWCAAVVWFAAQKRLFTGKEIVKGDSIVAFRENGFRSNGLSLARKALSMEHGLGWHQATLDGKKLGELVLEPSKIYTSAIVGMHGGFATEGSCEIHGVAHLTGGGLPGKLGRVLKPSGLGAELDDLFAPCDAMLHCQDVGGVSDREAYRTWNMGQGLLVITPEPDSVISEAKKYGVQAQLAGRVSDGNISLVSRGFSDGGQKLSFKRG